MNKREARNQAQENTRSIGDLMQLIAAARGRGGMSRVNPQFPLEEVLDIYEGVIGKRPMDEVPDGMTSRNSLIIANILRDCA